MILKCSCEHKYQDEKYGKGMRVHTPKMTGKSGGQQIWRCTVCLKERTER